jgi:5-methylcytosine-specific restriction endonuclease McrA
VSALTDRCAATHADLCAREPGEGRICTRCDERKPLEQFHRDPAGRLGRAYACKMCLRPLKRARQATVPVERRREALRRHRRSDPEGYNAKRRARYAGDPTATLIYNANRRSARTAAGSFTVGEWLELLTRYGHRCLACGTTERIEPDHVVPISWGVECGGVGTIDNIQPLCRSCNAAKGGRNARDYR